MLLSRKEKEKLVVQLAEEGKTTREIAKAVHISLKDIGKILRKVTGDNESPVEKEKEEDKIQKWFKSLSYYARAFQMFKDGKSLVDVAIEIAQETDTILNYYRDYLRLTRMKDLVTIYIELKDDFPLFFHLYRRIKKEGLNKRDIIRLLENQNKIVELDACVDLYNESIKNLQLQKINLEKEINGLRAQRDNYDDFNL